MYYVKEEVSGQLACTDASRAVTAGATMMQMNDTYNCHMIARRRRQQVISNAAAYIQPTKV
jgi:hypothetical protein